MRTGFLALAFLGCAVLADVVIPSEDYEGFPPDSFDDEITVTSVFDNEAPTVTFGTTGLDLDEPVVNITQGDQDQVISWSATNVMDTLAGVDWSSSFAYYEDEVGHLRVYSDGQCDDVSKSCSGDLIFITTLPPGLYTGHFEISDNRGNVLEVPLPDLEVANASPDLTPPVFSMNDIDIDFPNASSNEIDYIDTEEEPGQVDIYFEVSDDSGVVFFVEGAYIPRRKDDSGDVIYVGDETWIDFLCTDDDPSNMGMTGSDVAWYCRGTVKYDEDSRPDEYVMTKVVAYDKTMNKREWDLSGGEDVWWEVVNEEYQSMRAPTCDRLIIDMPTADTSADDDYVMVTLECEWYDGATDRNFLQVVFASPTVTVNGASTNLLASSSLMHFDNNNPQEWDNQVRFTAYGPAGIWTLHSILAITDSGDMREYRADIAYEYPESSTGDYDDGDDDNDSGTPTETSDASLRSPFVYFVLTLFALIFVL